MTQHLEQGQKSMRNIWKFAIPVEDEQIIAMPDGARVIHVGADPAGRDLCLWALVDSSKPTIPRRVFVRGTGHPVPESGRHVGSTVMSPFVWHVFIEPTTGDLIANLLGYDS